MFVVCFISLSYSFNNVYGVFILFSFFVNCWFINIITPFHDWVNQFFFLIFDREFVFQNVCRISFKKGCINYIEILLLHCCYIPFISDIVKENETVIFISINDPAVILLYQKKYLHSCYFELVNQWCVGGEGYVYWALIGSFTCC